MESAAILEFPPNLVESVRKVYNLDKPGQMEESIRLLNDWIQKQAHFIEKDFSSKYLERLILTSKGSVEHAKVKVDKCCTFKTLMPHFFDVCDASELQEVYTCGSIAVLPKLGQDLYRTAIYNIKTVKRVNFLDIFKYTLILSEYVILNDYSIGYNFVLDFTLVDFSEGLKKCNMTEMHQFLTISLGAYKGRIKGIHLITKSKLVEIVLSLLSKIFSPKLMSRVYVHKTAETLKTHIPEDILPVEYGGKERSIDELHEECYKALTSKQHIADMEKLRKCCTNEAYRPKDQFNDKYIDLAGTFRTLTVD